MSQRVPDFDLVEHKGPMVCDFCHEEVAFLVGITQTETDLDGNHCKDCFYKKKPEFSDAIADFADLLEIIIEMKARNMTLDEMYELYGNDEPAESEEEEDDGERETPA